MAAEPVQSVARRLFEMQTFDCREVDLSAGPEYADPRRALFLLGEYWDVLRLIVIADSHAVIYYVPHSLTPVLVNLRERINGCFDRLGEIGGKDDAKNAMNGFLACLLGGDRDALPVAEEYVNSQLAQTEVFLQEAKLLVGRKTFELTFTEQAFFKVARQLAEDYKRKIKSQAKRFDAYVNSPKFWEMRKTRQAVAESKPAEQAASPGESSEPTAPAGDALENGWMFTSIPGGNCQDGDVHATNVALCREYARLDELDLLAISDRWRKMATEFTEAAKRTGHYHGYIKHDDEIRRVTKLLETAVSQRGIDGVNRLGRCLRRPDGDHLHWAIATLDELDARLRAECCSVPSTSKTGQDKGSDGASNDDSAILRPLMFGNRYDQLACTLISRLTDYLPLPDIGMLERNEQRIVLEVQKTTGMTPEHWAKLSKTEREPWLERTLELLKSEEAIEAHPPVKAVAVPEDDSDNPKYDPPLSHIDLAEKYGRDPEATRKMLDRWRKKNGDGWHEVDNRRQNEPKYLYRLSAVRALFE
jgi:hypothetical protein